MTFLIVGVVLLVLAFLMIRIARPQLDGHPAPFLHETGLIVPYTVAFTAAVGFGIACLVAGIIDLLNAIN